MRLQRPPLTTRSTVVFTKPLDNHKHHYIPHNADAFTITNKSRQPIFTIPTADDIIENSSNLAEKVTGPSSHNSQLTCNHNNRPQKTSQKMPSIARLPRCRFAWAVGACLSLASVAAATPTPVATPDSTHTSPQATHGPNETIAPFHSNLDGVNQPVNILFADMLWWTLGIFGFAVLAIRLYELAYRKLRQVHAMTATREQQAYWTQSEWSWMPMLKKHLIYAPLWNKRNLREFKLGSSAVSMGILPSRIHTLLLGVLIISNIIYMFFLNWANKNKWAFLAELRGRSGVLAAVNMLPLVIFAGRNNPLIGILHISFDTYNLYHRWIGRMATIEAIIHTMAWAAVAAADGGMNLVWDKLLHDDFCASGMAGTIAMSLLLLQSVSPLRHAFYETFLNTHIILAFVVLVGTYLHCVTATIPGVGQLPQTNLLIVLFVLWFSDRLARLLRIVYYNWSSRGKTEALVEAMPGDAIRVTMQLPRFVPIKPGSHAYLRFGQASWWESHPFSIGWIEHTPEATELPSTEKDSFIGDRKVATTVSFIIGAQAGMTRKLYNLAASAPSESVVMRAVFEGPYGGHHSLDSFGHVVLFAGATGITHQIPYLKPLIEGYNNGTVATRKITLVWIVRDYEALEWVKPWMNEVLKMPNRKECLRINLFITRPKNPSQVVSASNTVELFPGRPNIDTILRQEVANQVGAMAVTVCGPGALADDVAASVRKAQDGERSISLFRESFSW